MPSKPSLTAEPILPRDAAGGDSRDGRRQEPAMDSAAEPFLPLVTKGPSAPLAAKESSETTAPLEELLEDKTRAEDSKPASSLPASSLPASPRGMIAGRGLAARHRPRRFDEIIGQEPLVRTLRQALRSQRLASAYLFCGTRGVGKTTAARLLARAVNCAKLSPDQEPCGDCDSCIAAVGDRHLDIFEMDAASHSGVDDIRELVESAPYRPLAARYKINLLDEVHMLSRAAFNSLLKLVEEPPAHLIFLFATTEPQKIPATLISRCQRFDLRRLSATEITAHLQAVAAQEGIAVTADATRVLARAADGSLRDGLSLLDQAATSLGRTTIEAKDIRTMIGWVDPARASELLDAALAGAPSQALILTAALHRDGLDPITLINALLTLLHEAACAALRPASEDTPADASAWRALALPELTKAWQILLQGHGELLRAPDPQAACDMLMLRLAHACRLPTPLALLRHLSGPESLAQDPLLRQALETFPDARLVGLHPISDPSPGS